MSQLPLPPLLSGPVFVMQWLFDLAQLMIFNVTVTGQPVLQGEWNYLQSLGKNMKRTLLRVSYDLTPHTRSLRVTCFFLNHPCLYYRAAFAPSCLAHELINSK